MGVYAEGPITDPKDLGPALRRAIAVVKTCAQAFNKVPRTEGRGRGFGFARYKNQKTYCAVGIELSVTEAAEVKLHRCVIAADAGEIVDPDGTAAQMEGGVLQAASWTLYEEVKYDRGGVTKRDRGRYEDVCVKIGGRWLFKSRSFRNIHRDDT